MMKKILYVFCLAGVTVLVSYYGGNIPWMLFYFVLLLPVLAFVYLLYVYLRFRIAQEVARTVVKGQKVPYRLILANEDYLPFSNITLHYFEDKVTIQNTDAAYTDTAQPDAVHSDAAPDAVHSDMQDGVRELCLQAKEQIQVDTHMVCKYRGTYPVGVKSVSVTDFFGLFTITYPMKELVRVTARPRIIPFEQLLAGIQQKEPKQNRFSAQKKQELPDFELRQYQPGDPVKYIHWKNSARAGELLVRKQMPEELFEMTVFLDLCPVEGEEAERLVIEDKVIEAAVSFVHYYFTKKIPVRVVYFEQQLHEILVDERAGFEAFYEMSAQVAFAAEKPVEAVWESDQAVRKGESVVIITPFIREGLERKVSECQKSGAQAFIIEAGGLSL